MKNQLQHRLNLLNFYRENKFQADLEGKDTKPYDILI